VLLLLFVAPLFQIILLALKVKGRINMPPGLIAISTFILGIALATASMNLADSDIHPNPTGPKCGIISVAFLLTGLFITAVATPIIELIFFAIRRLTQKNNIVTIGKV
jgi:hypothetical protein